MRDFARLLTSSVGDLGTSKRRLFVFRDLCRQQPLWFGGCQLRQWIALDTGHNAANQPGRLTEFDHGDQARMLVKGDEGPTGIKLRSGHLALHP